MYTYRSGDPPKDSWIKKENLVTGAWYKGRCRNADYAQWNGTQFVYLRHKFGFSFLEEIEHPEDDRGFDVFFPFAKADEKDVPYDSLLNQERI